MAFPTFGGKYLAVTSPKKILEREKISIQNLAENIDLYVKKYDTYGSEEEYGNRSHKAFINALKRFQDFCK